MGQILFDGGDLLGTDPFHVVPKALTGELASSQRQEAAQHGFAIPVGDLCFAGGRQAAVEGGQQKILANGRSLGSVLGDVVIDGGDHIESLGVVEIRGGTDKFLYSDVVSM